MWRFLWDPLSVCYLSLYLLVWNIISLTIGRLVVVLGDCLQVYRMFLMADR